MPEKLDNYSKIGPDQIEAIADIVDETLNGNIVSMIVSEKKNKLSIPAIRKKPTLEIIPISQGCLGNCSYCITKKARGDLHSYPIKDILATAEKAIKEGVKEIWLTSQDTGCYGFDIGTSLPKLIDELVEIPGDYMIRIGMMNPNHCLKLLPKIIAMFKKKKVFKFIHIPVQSGNNYVLEDMNRKYTAEDYIHIVNKLRKEIPEITISTDIIVAYPTEKKEFFIDSLNLIKNTKPDVLNLSRYWPRPHTKAKELKPLPGGVSKARAVELMHAFHWIAYERNKTWLGWQGPVLVNERGKNNTWKARNYAYKTVIIDQKVEIGKKYKVKIIKAGKHDIVGEVI